MDLAAKASGGQSAASSKVFRPDRLNALDRGNGVRTVPMVSSNDGSTHFLNGMTIFAPGASVARHSHNVPESVMVIQGNAVLNVDGEETSLKTFDTTFVPANVPHFFTNASDELEMRIFWTYGSVNATRTLTSTGKTERIDVEQGAIDPNIHIVETLEVTVKSGHEADFEHEIAASAALFQQQNGALGLELDRLKSPQNSYRLRLTWDELAHSSQASGDPSIGSLIPNVLESYCTGDVKSSLSSNVFTGF